MYGDRKILHEALVHLFYDLPCLCIFTNLSANQCKQNNVCAKYEYVELSKNSKSH